MLNKTSTHSSSPPSAAPLSLPQRGCDSIRSIRPHQSNRASHTFPRSVCVCVWGFRLAIAIVLQHPQVALIGPVADEAHISLCATCDSNPGLFVGSELGETTFPPHCSSVTGLTSLW